MSDTKREPERAEAGKHTHAAMRTQFQLDGMAGRPSRVESILLSRGLITPDDVKAAKDRQIGAKRPLVEILLEQGAVDETAMVEALAHESGMRRIASEDLAPDPAIQDVVPSEIALRFGVLPLRLEGNTLLLATVDPFQLPLFDELTALTQLRVRPVFAAPTAVRAALRAVREGDDALDDLLKNAPLAEADLYFSAERAPDAPATAEPKESGPEVLGLEGTAQDGPVVRFVNLILADGIRQKASDVHIEPEKTALRVRFRIDGELREVQRVPIGTHAHVVSRLKIVSGLDIMETRRPQDGRAKVDIGGKSYDLRLSTIPSYFGEKVVVRILDANAPVFDLAKSGIEAEDLAEWREMLHRPHGLVLVTGPTGSGKTSTLYASLLEVRDPSLNIVTVEDPVEFQFPGIVHVPVRTDIGMTFAAALRSILRQDPDVVLLGEIRDSETAEVAIRAALTGHLVLSTLHTNDAVGALPRLVNLGVDPQMVASCLLGVMAQRLARTICESCAEVHLCPPEILSQLGDLPPGASTEATRKGRGCNKCRGTGMKGRTALTELVRMTPGMREAVLRDAKETELREQARLDGTTTLAESGLHKVLRGIMSVEEVLSVAEPAPRPKTRPARGAETPRPAPAAPTAPTAPGATPASAAEAPAGLLRADAEDVPPTPCAVCGEALRPAWRLCPVCGTAAADATTGPVAVVCDDQDVQRRIVVAALKGEFSRIVEAKDGLEGLDAVARSKPAILIVDQVMPHLTGLEVIRTLRSQLETASLPILMLTADDTAEMERSVLQAGADDYLTKPVPPDRLRARVKALLSARRRRTSSGALTTTRA